MSDSITLTIGGQTWVWPDDFKEFLYVDALPRLFQALIDLGAAVKSYHDSVTADAGQVSALVAQVESAAAPVIQLAAQVNVQAEQVSILTANADALSSQALAAANQASAAALAVADDKAAVQAQAAQVGADALAVAADRLAVDTKASQVNAFALAVSAAQSVAEGWAESAARSAAVLNRRWAGISAGTVNALVLTPATPLTSYEGAVIDFIAAATNGGAATVAVSGLAAVAILMPDGSALTGGALVGGTVYRLVHDGSAFRVSQIQQAATAAQDWNSAVLFLRSLGVTSPYALLFGGLADSYNDSSGIGASSGISYDATNKWYANFSDSYWSNVSLLLHMDGSMADSSLSARTVTPYNITYSSTDYAFGTGGAMLNGSNGHIRVPFAAVDFATNDFTVEGFFKPTAAGSDSYGSILFDSPNSTSTTANFGVAMNSGRQLGIYLIYSGSSWAASTVSTNALTLGTRYHIRFKRTGNLFTLEVNGTVWCSLTSSLNMSTYTDGGFNIGGTIDGYGPRAFAGAVDEFRITKGVARTDAVPIAAFPDSGSGGVGSITSIAYTALTAPVTARLLIRYQDVNGAGIALNSELVLKASRDNGATWTTATLVDGGPFDATTRMAIAVVSVAGQPSGTALKYKIETSTAKIIRLRGTVLLGA